MDSSGLRIGELARLAGVSTRMIRHYHQVGVLPEPARSANGYRVYDLRDVVLLLRVRQLVELGLSLDEARDALAEAGGRELREVLAELDADLAEQERRIADRRFRVAGLISLLDAGDGEDKEAALELVVRAADLGKTALERERLTADLIEVSTDPNLLPQIWSGYQQLLGNRAGSTAVAEFSRQFDQLAGLDPQDPAVDALAERASELGDTVLGLLPQEVKDGPGDPEAADRLLTVLQAGTDPAQGRCLRLMFAAWKAAAS